MPETFDWISSPGAGIDTYQQTYCFRSFLSKDLFFILVLTIPLIVTIVKEI